MVYSSGFKFVQSHNDRFSGCVDDSYRRYAIFDFEERFVATWAQLVVFVFEHLCFPGFQVKYRDSVVVTPGTTTFKHENIAVIFIVKRILRLAIHTVNLSTGKRLCSINVFDVVWQFYLFRRSEDREQNSYSNE